MNNQTLFQIVQSAGGMHLLYNNDIEQVRAIAKAAFEAGKAQMQEERDRLEQQLSQLENWTGTYYARGQLVKKEDVPNLRAAIASNEAVAKIFGGPGTQADASDSTDADKQSAGVQDVLDMSDSRNWQVGDVVCSNSLGSAHTVMETFKGGLRISGSDMAWPHDVASGAFAWISNATKESAK